MSAEYESQFDRPDEVVIDYDQLPKAVQEYKFDLERSLALLNGEEHDVLQFPGSDIVEKPEEADDLDEEDTKDIENSVQLYFNQAYHPVLSYDQEQLLFRMGPIDGRRDVPIEAVTSHPDFATVLAGFSQKDRRRFQHIVADSKNLQSLLVSMNLRLVAGVAKKYSYNPDQLLENIQEGNLSLMHAVERFDPDRPYDDADPEGRKLKFSTYGIWWIRQGVGRAIDNTARTIRLPVHAEESIRRARKKTHALQQRLGREITYRELRDSLAADGEKHPDFLAEQIKYGNITHPLSLDKPISSDSETTLADLIPSSQDVPFEEGAYLQERKEGINDFLEGLSKTQQLVIRKRFGFDGKQHTLAETGMSLGVSRERVRQIQEEAMRNLRRPAFNTRVRHFVDETDTSPINAPLSQRSVMREQTPRVVVKQENLARQEHSLTQEKHENKQKHELPENLQEILTYYFNGRRDKRPILERLSTTYGVSVNDLEQLIQMTSVVRGPELPFKPNGGTIFTAGEFTSSERVRILKNFSLSQEEIIRITGLSSEIVSYFFDKS